MKKWAWIALSLCTCALSSQAQTPTREQLIGTWIGVRVELDEHFDRPYPLRMTFKADSAYTLGLLDENPPAHRATWSLVDQKIRLDTSTYAANQWTLRNNELRLEGPLPIVFRRLVPVAVDLSVAQKVLADQVWATDSLKYHLHSDGSAYLENTRTGNVAMHCWRLMQVEQSLFLVIKGNQNGCKGNFQYPLQIVQLSSTSMRCLGGSSQESSQPSFRRLQSPGTNEMSQPKGFQLCNSYVFPSFNLYPYFTYKRGRLYNIRQIVEREYKPINQPGQSGLIRFRFVVNCKGEAGQFEILEVNENYEKCAFNPQITNQLLMICRDKLTDWEAGQPTGEPNQEPVDTFCLLTFRLKNGLITEIFP